MENDGNKYISIFNIKKDDCKNVPHDCFDIL